MLNEEGEGAPAGDPAAAPAGPGTSTADIAPVTYPIGTLIRHTRKDDEEEKMDYLRDSIEMSLSESAFVPKELRDSVLKAFIKRNLSKITERDYSVDDIELELCRYFNETWHFKGFDNYKAKIIFESDSNTFCIYQYLAG